jgi:hypothetical protein
LEPSSFAGDWMRFEDEDYEDWDEDPDEEWDDN